MAYTPSATFSFHSGNYTPSLLFDFDVFGLYGNFSATLEDTTGSVIGHISPRGVITGQLDDTSGYFCAALPLKGEFSATLEDTTGSLAGSVAAVVGVFSATLEDTTGAVSAVYDPNMIRYTTSAVRAGCDATTSYHHSCLAHIAQTVPSHDTCQALQQQASALGSQLRVDLSSSLAQRHCVRGLANEAERLRAALLVPVDALAPTPSCLAGAVDQATPVSNHSTIAFDELCFITVNSRHRVDDSGGEVHEIIHRVYGELAAEDRYTPGLNFTLISDGMYSPSVTFVWPHATPVIDWRDSQQLGGIRHSISAPYQPTTKRGGALIITVQDAMQPWTGGSYIPGGGGTTYPPLPPPTDPPGHTTYSIPLMAAYVMQHTISVTLLDLTPVAMDSVSLSLDADSYAWQFRGSLASTADLSKVQQNGMAEPVQLMITINGYTWRVLVEDIEHSRQFANKSITVSGRGLTALLGQPYEQPASATQSSDLTVQQLAELQLPVGWTLVWTASTWLVPSGVYSYTSQTPIQALAKLVSDIGGMLVPNRDSQVINIMPRYPVLPWHFDVMSPDITVTESIILDLSQRPVVPYQANGVYVHGAEIGGKLAWCHLQGTDGARLAATESNALMTDAVGCRALGERIIAGQYSQPAVRSFTVPLDGATVPLFTIGQLVQVTIDNQPVRGIVNSVGIEAKLGSVRQTIHIGETTPNTWAMFKELLPRDPLLVGTLASTDGVTSLITLLDGGVVRVRGGGTVGGKYYIRAGKIDGEAPNLIQDEIVI